MRRKTPPAARQAQLTEMLKTGHHDEALTATLNELGVQPYAIARER